MSLQDEGCPPLSTYAHLSREAKRRALDAYSEECKNLHMFGHINGPINVVVQQGGRIKKTSTRAKLKIRRPHLNTRVRKSRRKIYRR